jgi:hypothetical protein
MSNYKCSKCNNELKEIGIPPQIQILQSYKNVMNIGAQVSEEIKNDPFLYKGLYCPSCKKAFCPPCAKMQSQICPGCGQAGLMPAYRPLLNKKTIALKDINFAAMPQIAVRVVTKPTEFFKTMPKTGGFLEPLVFAIIMGVVAGVIQVIWRFLGFGFGSGMGASLYPILFMPIAAIIGSFIGAAVIFVIWKLMGSPENYETSYRCMAYLMALAPITAILSVIPYAGVIINMAIFVYFIVIASTQVHNIPSQKAWLVFGIIGIILVLFSLKSEYSLRNMSSQTEQWKKSSQEMQKQAEEMARQYRKQAEQNK